MSSFSLVLGFFVGFFGGWGGGGELAVYFQFFGKEEKDYIKSHVIHEHSITERTRTLLCQKVEIRL